MRLLYEFYFIIVFFNRSLFRKQPQIPSEKHYTVFKKWSRSGRRIIIHHHYISITAERKLCVSLKYEWQIIVILYYLNTKTRVVFNTYYFAMSDYILLTCYYSFKVYLSLYWRAKRFKTALSNAIIIIQSCHARGRGVVEWVASADERSSLWRGRWCTIYLLGRTFEKGLTINRLQCCRHWLSAVLWPS